MKLIQSIDPVETYEKIKRDYLNYLSTAFHIKDPELEFAFLEKIHAYNFINGPILEATPPFKQGCLLQALANDGTINQKTVDVFLEAFPFMKDKPLYLHQERSIRKLHEGRNLIISAGTSSGKTECFLIPIIDHLFNQFDAGHHSPGVRALLLYPMNALVNDQVVRLRKISEIINRKYPQMNFSFGRYVGDTQDTQREALKEYHKINGDKDPVEGELLSRDVMRETPPNILITNYAMLEYLLLRPTDSSLFDGHNARFWRFIVLDEAHTYNGANGIEMSMLISRLKDRICNGEKGRIQSIATSATLFNDEKDFRRVVNFASKLFGEVFSWKHDSPAEQDLIIGSRMDIESMNPEHDLFEIPLKSYSKLKAVLNEAPDPDDVSPALGSGDYTQRLLSVLKEIAVPALLLKKNAITLQDDVPGTMFNIFQHEAHVMSLRRELQKKPVILGELPGLFGIKEPMKEDVQGIIDLIAIGAYARQSDISLPLIPARYHLFIRQPDGLYCSFYPKKDVFLDRHEMTCDEHPVFEMVTCNRCGQGYLVGAVLADNKLTHAIKHIPNSKENLERRFFFIQNSESAPEADEDEDLYESSAEKKNEKDDRWQLCIKCGQIWRPGKGGACEHEKEPVIISLIEVYPKDRTLTKCTGCGYRAQNVVREFRFQQDAPASVFLTSIYAQLESREKSSRKILSFSDSRQDAAFFATYFDSTYNRLLARRLIFETVRAQTDEDIIADYRLESLQKDVLQLMIRSNCFRVTQDAKEKKRIAWGSVLQEFFSEDTRMCLEGTGLLAYYPIFPEGWKPAPQLMQDDWSLSNADCQTLYTLMLDSLRSNKVITYPPDGPPPEDQVFSRFNRNREYYIRGVESDSKSAIFSFIPSNNHYNNRLTLLAKLFRRINGREAPLPMLREILGAVWDGLLNVFQNRGIVAEKKAGKGYVYRLDYRFWRIQRVEGIASLYRCDQCGRITVKNLRSICTTYGCNGQLVQCTDSLHGRLVEQNHYRQLYQNMPIVNMVSHEHTAQLNSDYGAEVQQRFVQGDINVLSCSTTFELGVDLGDLDLIFLRNVPPEPANYIQRSGRAGRRVGRIGFTTTLARNRSHDLYYFNRPNDIVAGSIKPPILEIENEKIVRRHMHSVVLASFFRKYPESWTTVDAFFNLKEKRANHVRLLKSFLDARPITLKTSLERIIPPNMHEIYDIDGWGWVPFLIKNGVEKEKEKGDIEENGEAFKIGLINKVEQEIQDEFTFLQDYITSNKDEITKAGTESKTIKKFAWNIEWAERRQNTICNRKLIDFLSSKSILPKYGFPVDVVELTVLSTAPQASQIQLDRDLKLAISEFAPGSQVVANGMLWTSYAIKTLRARAWPVYEYFLCPDCGNLIRNVTMYDQSVEA
nr:DEAD/DEAH box helicase [Candidatus Sigynarchaeota archaeon]